MTYRFDPRKPLIITKAKLFGPRGDTTIQLALDTGASSSLINWNALQLVGYDAADGIDDVTMATGSGVERVPRLKVKRLEAFGKRRSGLWVVAHTLPAAASVDGLLGLDFFRNWRLVIDFRKHTVKID